MSFYTGLHTGPIRKGRCLKCICVATFLLQRLVFAQLTFAIQPFSLAWRSIEDPERLGWSKGQVSRGTERLHHHPHHRNSHLQIATYSFSNFCSAPSLDPTSGNYVSPFSFRLHIFLNFRNASISLYWYHFDIDTSSIDMGPLHRTIKGTPRSFPEESPTGKDIETIIRTSF